MTVTPLSGRDHRSPLPTSPRGRREVARPRHVTSVGADTDPAGLTVSFEITLTGPSRYRDAMDILDTLRAVAGRLGDATLEVGPSHLGDGPYPSTTDQRHPAAPTTLSILDGYAPSESEVDSADGVVEVMADSRSVLIDGAEISLTRVEFDLLTFLAENPRRVFGRAQLLKNVWGYEHTGERTVDVHIRRLRAKLGNALIITVRSVGYRLADGAKVRVLRLPF